MRQLGQTSAPKTADADVEYAAAPLGVACGAAGREDDGGDGRWHSKLPTLLAGGCSETVARARLFRS